MIMKELIDSFKDVKHIELEVMSEEFLFATSLLYRYILTLHKKVTIVTKIEIDSKFLILPWLDKAKQINSNSANLVVKIDFSALTLYEYLKSLDIKINKKMATSVYAELIYKTDCFTFDNCDGSTFALASELVGFGAEHKTIKNSLVVFKPLSYLRLKALMLQGMILKDDAQVAQFFISDDILKKSGATYIMAKDIVKEAYSLEYVKRVELIDLDLKKDILNG